MWCPLASPGKGDGSVPVGIDCDCGGNKVKEQRAAVDVRVVAAFGVIVVDDIRIVNGDVDGFSRCERCLQHLKRGSDIGKMLSSPKALIDRAASDRHIATVVREKGESIDKSALSSGTFPARWRTALRDRVLHRRWRMLNPTGRAQPTNRQQKTGLPVQLRPSGILAFLLHPLP